MSVIQQLRNQTMNCSDKIFQSLFLKQYSPTQLILFLFIPLAALLVLTRWYWFLGDDCFISFRYSRHLADGLGLCFNQGERVEGYTNFLWVMLMSWGMWLGVDPELFSNVLGSVSGLILILLVFRMGQQIFGRSLIILLAPACLCLSRTYACWMTGGLETRFFSLLLFAANMALLRETGVTNRTAISGNGWVSGLLFGLAALTRPEGYMFMALGLVLVAIFRSFRLVQQDYMRLAFFLLCAVPHLVWRYAYYGDLLPNTFYAKVSGIWLSQGALYLGGFFIYYFLWLLAPLAAGNLGFLSSRQGRIQWNVPPFTAGAYFSFVSLVYISYLLIIGGDRFEYRLLDPVLPFIYLSIQGGLAGAYYWLKRQNPADAGKKIMLCSLPVVIVLVPFLTAVPIAVGFRNYRGITGVENISSYAQNRIRQGKLLSAFIRPEDTLAVMGAGALPYYNTNNYVLDMHGLNDRVLARQALEKRGTVGHEKNASKEYICSKNITFVDNNIELFFSERPEASMISLGANMGFFCVKISTSQYFLCTTTLSSEQIRKRFAGYEIIFLPADNWCDQKKGKGA